VRPGGQLAFQVPDNYDHPSHRSADEACAIPGLVQPVHHPQRVGRDLTARDAVLLARDAPQARHRACGGSGAGAFATEELEDATQRQANLGI